MAVGVPATGIGGIFYILLSIVMLFYEIIKKFLSFMGKKIPRSTGSPSRLLRFPTVAFTLCVLLLLYMNVTGFRFVLPGTQQAVTVSITNLWIIGVFAVGIFGFFLVLFQLRANQRNDAPTHTKPIPDNIEG